VKRALWLLGVLTACELEAEPLGASSDEALTTLFEELHRPVYGVYELTDDRDALHDLLAASFTGQELTAQYIEHFTSMHHMSLEEVSIQVLRVDYDDIHVSERTHAGVRISADWSVGGVVTHQGHKHARVNRYSAVYTVEMTAEGPRFTDARMRNAQRVERAVDGASAWGLPTSGAGLMDPLELLEAGLLDDTDDTP
jgi:hypothetical protein